MAVHAVVEAGGVTLPPQNLRGVHEHGAVPKRDGFQGLRKRVGIHAGRSRGSGFHRDFRLMRQEHQDKRHIGQVGLIGKGRCWLALASAAWDVPVWYFLTR